MVMDIAFNVLPVRDESVCRFLQSLCDSHPLSEISFLPLDCYDKMKKFISQTRLFFTLPLTFVRSSESVKFYISNILYPNIVLTAFIRN